MNKRYDTLQFQQTLLLAKQVPTFLKGGTLPDTFQRLQAPQNPTTEDLAQSDLIRADLQRQLATEQG